MTTDDFTEAARAEAERRAPLDGHPAPALAQEREGLIAMAIWARDHLAAQNPLTEAIRTVANTTVLTGQDIAAIGSALAKVTDPEPTDAEVEAAAVECVKFLFLTAPERPWEDPEVVEQWDPMARIALRAAYAARRGEEKR